MKVTYLRLQTPLFVPALPSFTQQLSLHANKYDMSLEGNFVKLTVKTAEPTTPTIGESGPKVSNTVTVMIPLANVAVFTV